MVYLLAVVAGIVAAVLGWLISGALAAWIAGLFGMSDFEGGRGMFAFLAVGPLGGLLAMTAAVWAVLRAGKGRAPLGRTLGRLGLALCGIAALVGGGIALRLATLDTYSDRLPPRLEFELRMPAAPAASDLRVELHTDKNSADALLNREWLGDGGGNQTLGGSVELYFKTSSRLLVVMLPGEPVRLFRLHLARAPEPDADFGEWQRADHIDPGGGAPIRAAPPDDPIELRYRVP